MSDTPSNDPVHGSQAQRVEVLIDALLRGGPIDAATSAESAVVRQVMLVRDAIASDTADLPQGVPSGALVRAKALSSLLPQPSASGVRVWWDRAVAAIASCVHDDTTSLATVGIRRGTGTRQVSFDVSAAGQPVSIDLEIGQPGPDGSVAIRGQVCAPSGCGGLPVTLVRDPQAPLHAITDRDGFFLVHAAPARYDLAVHLGEAGAVVAPNLDIP